MVRLSPGCPSRAGRKAKDIQSLGNRVEESPAVVRIGHCPVNCHRWPLCLFHWVSSPVRKREHPAKASEALIPIGLTTASLCCGENARHGDANVSILIDGIFTVQMRRRQIATGVNPRMRRQKSANVSRRRRKGVKTLGRREQSGQLPLAGFRQRGAAGFVGRCERSRQLPLAGLGEW